MKIIVFGHEGSIYRIPDKLFNELVDCEPHTETHKGFDEAKFDRAYEIKDLIKQMYKPIFIDHIFTGYLG
jgi:hypothetical protein